MPRFEESTVDGGQKRSRDKIALISLRGMISSSIQGKLYESAVDDMRGKLRQALRDKKVKAIVLRIDSPGGEVTASDILYSAVREAREKKPIVVYMESVAASGGYYIACGGSHLMASETTTTGSIGVLLYTLKYKELFGKIGLESIVFKSGKFKDLLSGAREITKEERIYVQGLVMQIYERFVSIVAKERNLPLDDLKEGIADGRVVTGRDALKYGLIDEIGYLEDAFEKARELGETPGAPVVRYVEPFRLGSLFRFFGGKRQAAVEVDLTAGTIPQLESGKVYLLPPYYVP